MNFRVGHGADAGHEGRVWTIAKRARNDGSAVLLVESICSIEMLFLESELFR